MLNNLLSFFGSKFFFGLVLVAAAIGWWFVCPAFLERSLVAGGGYFGWVIYTVVRIGGVAALGGGGMILLTAGVNDLLD